MALPATTGAHRRPSGRPAGDGAAEHLCRGLGRNERAKVITFADLAFACPTRPSKEVMPLLARMSRCWIPPLGLPHRPGMGLRLPGAEGPERSVTYPIAWRARLLRQRPSSALPGLWWSWVAPADYPFQLHRASPATPAAARRRSPNMRADRPAHSNIDAPRATA